MSDESFETVDAWDLRDNLENSDADFPLGFSQALWDELTQNDLESTLLFATPMTDTLISDPVLDALSSQESSVQGIHAADSRGGSPRPKRRRLFNDVGQVSTDSDAPSREMLTALKSGEDVPEAEQHENSISVPSVWYKDKSQRTSPAETTEQMAESWMITCFKDSDSNSSVNHMETTMLVAETPGNRLNTVRKLKISAPVAYPFTMVKPLGTEGDMTLTDINQHIATLPEILHQGPVSSTSVRPSSKLDSLTSLSGKSVVAYTRICTEGNGTITILRTIG